MKKARQWQRILILSLLCFTVLAPVFFVSNRLKNLSSFERKDFVEDLTVLQRYGKEVPKLNVIEQEADEGLKEPKLVVYEENDLGSAVIYSSVTGNNNTLHLGSTGENGHDFEQPGSVGYANNHSERTNRDRRGASQKIQRGTDSFISDGMGQRNKTTVRGDQNLHPRHATGRATDQKIKEVKDQLIRAKAYLNFAPPGSNSHLVKELRQQMKELERAVGEVDKDSDLSKSALHKMRSMDVTLSKASHVFSDCSTMATKLRAMTYNAKGQVQAQKNQVTYLVELAARATPKGFHCLAMRLTTEFFALSPEERRLPINQRVHDPDLYHYAVFSDNVLACAVVVNSTVAYAMEAEKIVFHVVTDSLNLPAISMWFLLNPPGRATIQIQSIDNFAGLSSKYNSTLEKRDSHDSRYASALNHLRFYLPDVFPLLDKIVFLDHDVVVQRDLTTLWSLDMQGKVNGAVETCQESEASYRRMDMFINFSDPFVTKRFDVKACTWAFGLNLFDLREWRRLNLTALYHKYLQLGYERPLWKAGRLPLGWATFYNQTIALERRWHRLGLGYESGVGRYDIENAGVIHYDGVMKPWLDIGIRKYKSYWSKHVNFDHPFLQQCNIHE